MKLSVVIVNYNVRYFLEQALLAVEKAGQNITTEIFVVDNNSTDDSVEMVRRRFPSVKLIANTDNPGFSIANNQAIRQAKGEYVLLLNPDTVVAEDTFEKCIQFMDAHLHAGGLGVKMIDGSGTFLPESKRGFPSPYVAFCKTVGLSKLFPHSRLFNRYHLGYLDKDEIHEIDVLAGAFMCLRKSVLEEIGLLDEQFFMYGEDIDLSYRIKKGGYKNYYFSETSIIHYKGESTKKGSLNYVKVFYNAMILFAQKHFHGTGGALFVLMLRLAIYFRAFITLLSNFIKKAAYPILDILLISGGLFLLKDFWANYYYDTPDYYSRFTLWFNMPLYSLVWVSAIFLSGGYDEPKNLRRLIRGVFFGAIFLSAIYGFLDLEFRFSRMLILLSTFWAFLILPINRFVIHFLQYRNFNLGKNKHGNLIIVGNKKETGRVLSLLQKSQVQKNIIGTVYTTNEEVPENSLGHFSKIKQIIKIYKIDEIIFCAENISNKKIINCMSEIGQTIQYKILPPNASSIIGSRSKNTSGQLYIIDVNYRIISPINKRNKRMIDLSVSILCLLFFPILIWVVHKKISFVKNIFSVLFNKKSWVGYCLVGQKTRTLPLLKNGVLSPANYTNIKIDNKDILTRLNFLYAKDYTPYDDLEIILKNIRHL